MCDLVQFCNDHLPVKVSGNTVNETFISGFKCKRCPIFYVVALLVDNDLAGAVAIVFLYEAFVIKPHIFYIVGKCSCEDRDCLFIIFFHIFSEYAAWAYPYNYPLFESSCLICVGRRMTICRESVSVSRTFSRIMSPIVTSILLS